ncbi:MAG TPA: PQQ-dependent sugar dehydrogenase [Candidatus Eisenbacteria bacterium]|nr:PQQ-dependent sugar dehydrogenase [Candidatus Eisenbacteria bacterium]
MKSSQAPLLMLASLLFAGPVGAQQVGPLPDIPRGTVALHLHPLVTGLSAPDYGINPPGDLNRLFVVEQRGLILVIENGALRATPALDVQSRVSPPLNPGNANDERGLLGLAFSPGFNDPNHVGYRTLYTFSGEPIPPGTSPTYVAPNNATQNYKTVVNEYKMSATDPNVIDPTTRREIISFGKNAGNHNGGTVAFGPDGYMYLALGDGGNANDVGASHIEPGGNAQNLTTPLGKMLRFDPTHPSLTMGSADAVSANGQYRIPATNPFQGPGEVPETYATGLRNPYRFAFDRLNGELILADVGQNNVEEINRIALGGNYGWAVKEGDFLFNRANGTIGARSPGVPAGLIDPLSGPAGTLEYDHSDGISITGGFVYRGTAIPELYGKYVFGDLAIRNAPPRIDGRLFYADLASGEMAEFRLPLLANDKLPNQLTVHGFGEDGHGELYAMVTNTPANGTGGIVYKLSPVIPIEFSLKPETIVIGGQGSPRRVQAFLEPQPPYAAADIDVASIRINNSIPVDLSGSAPIVIGDEDEDGIPDLKVYFSRSALELALPIGEAVAVKVTGLLGASVGFEGNDTVRIKGGHVTQPTANQIVAPGEAFLIGYEVTTSAPSVAMMYSADGGASWSLQVSEAANTGTIQWNVPSEPSDNALVAVVEIESGQAGGEVTGVVAVSERFSISSGPVGVGGGRGVTGLRSPHPNPTGGPVTVGFSLARRGKVEISVFDLQGRQVADLAQGVYEAGSTEVVWSGRRNNGQQAEAGLYFVRLRADGKEWNKRLIRVN